MEKQTRNRIPKEELINLLIEFVNIYGREPKQQEKYKDANIGTFLSNIKHGNTALSSEYKTLLINSGIKITSNNKKDSVHNKVLLLVEFYNLYNRVPKMREVYKDVKIGHFLKSIRQGNTKLSSKDATSLTNIGIRINFNNQKDSVHKKTLLLIEFYNLYNHTPKKDEIYKNINLYNFLMSIRRGNTKLSSEDATSLTNMGIRITSNKRQYSTHEKALLLVEFYNLYNRSPKQQEEYKGFNIGTFLYSIRQDKVTLSSEDTKLLIDTGIRITSNKRIYSIHEKVLLLIEFYNLYNRAPKQSEIYKNIKLGIFLNAIRQKMVNLSPEDEEILATTGIRITANKKI